MLVVSSRSLKSTPPLCKDRTHPDQQLLGWHAKRSLRIYLHVEAAVSERMSAMGISAEELSTIGGIATVSTLHAFIPTHWLPFSVVGRAQKWTLTTTLLVSK